MGDERGPESIVTVLGVCCRIGGTDFGDCVGSDCVAFSEVLLSVGKIWILVLDFLSKIASAEITVDRFVDIAIDLVESLRKSSQVQQGGPAGGGQGWGQGPEVIDTTTGGPVNIVYHHLV